MEEEYEKFEITDYDLDNEFNPNRNRKKFTKNQQIYGVWADSDDDATELEMKGSKGGRKTFKDYTAPVSFVSGGVQQSGKKKEEPKDSKKKKIDDDEEDDTAHRGFGFKQNKASSDSSEEEVRPTFQPKEVAGMRQAKGSLSNKGLGNWEQHTKGIGAKLLLQMGYQPGKGLGKALQGISAPVEAHVRKGRGAIGLYGPEKKTKIAELKPSTKKDDDKKDGKSEEFKRQWSKKGHKKRQFKSVEDVIEKGKKPDYMLYDSGNKLSKVTVIDMTGPEKRVLSGYHALNQMKVADDDHLIETKQPDLKHFQLPELMHNLTLIVNMCEQDIISNDKRQRTAEERQRTIKNEKEQLEKIVVLEKKYIETLEDVEELVAKLIDTENPPSLEEAETIFIELKVSFPNEFKEFNLPDLAPTVIAPLINQSIKDWKPLEEPAKHIKIIKKWAGLLDYSKSSVTTFFDPYEALVWSCIVPYFRQAANEWNPKKHSQMAALLDAWSALMPERLLDNVLELIVLSRLTQAVNEWDPLTDIVPIHEWILPWSGILGDKMHENVYKTICDKLSKAFRAWHPQDRSALAMIRPWKNVFKDEDLQIFLHKNVVPKLEFRMNEIIIDPRQQDLEVFKQVYDWNELLTTQVMTNILDKYFFPKWIQTLVLWLNQSPNYEEISRWYKDWQSQFSETILKQPNINEHLRRALDLMKRATGKYVQEPVTVQPLPSLMDLNLKPPSTMNLEFKEIVSQKCAERGIIFAPMPGRRENGKQVYRLGKLFCYFDKSVCCVSPDPGKSSQWMPMSLSVILEKAK
ncbi:septin-interacting protein 1 [Chironomus tepperi]|uniref:septin-interacting protein 1 n=1 Tax=Chironomus tepperi TaxID=113505 RepID=UPI00391FBFF4